MARISDELADYTIITSDNPDFESPEAIAEDVVNRHRREKPYCIMTDREQAVRKAVDMSRCGDIVLFAGKGHEDYQLIEGRKVPFSEKEIILDEISRFTG